MHNCGYNFLKRICLIHILWTGQKYHNWPPGFGWLGLLVLVPVNQTGTKLNLTGAMSDFKQSALEPLTIIKDGPCSGTGTRISGNEIFSGEKKKP